MKKRYTEGQIVYALKQVELGEKVAEICRKLGVAEATFYNWRKKYKGMGVSELRRMKELEEENRRWTLAQSRISDELGSIDAGHRL